MTKHNLTTTELEIIESEDEDRNFFFSAGVFTTAVAVYIRVGDVGDPEVILSSGGVTALWGKIPSGRPVYAWTDAGTAVLCSALRK